MSSPSLPDAIRDRIEESLKHKITASEPGSTFPVVLTVPLAQEPSVAVLAGRISDLGGNVVRTLPLSGAVAAEVALPQLTHLLEEFTEVRAGLDGPGDLESGSPHG